MENEHDSSSHDEDERRPKEEVFTRKENGEPIPIHLHRSLGRGGGKALADKIRAAGGDPNVDEHHAEVIVCRDDQPIFKQLVFKYDHHRYVWVEAPSWVDVCIMKGKYEHIRPNRPKKRGPSERVAFTKEDDNHLVKFLAYRIPFKATGGRTGNNVYKDLCDPARAEQYPWAKRHTWQSWRDRYTKNQDIFDPRVAYAVQQDPDPPKPGAKGQYTIPTKSRNLPLRHTVQWSSDSEAEAEEAEVAEEAEEAAEEAADAEADKDVVVEQPLTKWHHKRPRPEDELHRKRHPPGHRQRSASPPRKQRRSRDDRREEEEDADADSGVARYNKAYQAVLESGPPLDQFEDDGVINDNDAYYEAGPSQFNDPLPPPTHKAAPNPPHGSMVPALEPPKDPAVPSGEKPGLEPSHLHKTSGSKLALPSAPPAASLSKGLSASQMTLVGPSQPHRDPHARPPDTKSATVVSSSQSPPQVHHQLPPPKKGTAREAPAPKPRYPNTRSRPQPVPVDPEPNAHPSAPVVKRGVGRPRKVRPQKPPSPIPPSAVREEFQQAGPMQGSIQAPGGASHRDEAQVEQILQPAAEDVHEEGSSSSSSAESSDDDQDDPLARKLHDDHQAFLSHPGASAPSVPKSSYVSASSTSASKLPRMTLPPSKGDGLPSRGVTGLQVSTANTHGRGSKRDPIGADVDSTPKARPMPGVKAAKKMAAVGSPSPNYFEDDGTDMRSDSQTGTSGSFPTSPLANAREYQMSKLEFAPARGTRADALVRSERAAKSDAKGKGKANTR